MRHISDPNSLGDLERLVMDFIWTNGASSAEQVREGLDAEWPMKDSTARTILRRLEEKGFLKHGVQGRTYIYQVVEDRQNVALRAVRQVVDRFCQGSIEDLLVGMVENEVIDEGQLERLARQVRKSRGSQGGKGRKR